MIVELSSVYLNIHRRNLLFVNSAEYKTLPYGLQDLRRKKTNLKILKLGLQFRAVLTQGSGRQIEVARVQAAGDL